jgi:hypothetical protein
MKAGAVGFLLLAVLSTGASARDARDDAWQASLSQIEADHQAGRMRAAEAYDQLRQRYRDIYGSDLGMRAYFAYARSLMTSVERGDIDLQEARLLLTAKEQEALQQSSVLRARRERYSYPEN